MDALIQVRDEQDATLSFRGSCRTGFCGDCTMGVNGKAKWACRMPVAKAQVKGEITLDPPRLVKGVKDLIYDQNEFLLDKYAAVKPWIESSPPSPTEEHIVSQKENQGTTGSFQLHPLRHVRRRLHGASHRQDVPGAGGSHQGF